jgi:NAD-dependent deacetylase
MATSEIGAGEVTAQFSDRMVSRLLHADRVVAFTGAGISAESGVPTFRGSEGIWSKFKPEELATMQAFLRNTELVWEWYAARKKIIANIQPNPGHYALVKMERLFGTFTVVTQNIDNLHRRAGSSTVYELHGNIERNYCITCGKPFTNLEVFSVQGVPRCDKCNGLIRPDVVWFGELLPEDEWEESVRAMESADVCLSIGTSGLVYPAADLPIRAKRRGAFLVEINPEPTFITPLADEFLCGPSGVILPALEEKVRCARHIGSARGGLGAAT